VSTTLCLSNLTDSHPDMHQRWPGSQQSEERDHVYREPLLAQTDEEKKRIFNSGGKNITLNSQPIFH
jgi:hypothetical protein